MLFIGIIALGAAAGWIAQMLLGQAGYATNWSLALASGLIGSFVGGTLFSLIAGDGFSLRPSGLIGSVVGAVIVTAGYNWWQRRQPTA